MKYPEVNLRKSFSDKRTATRYQRKRFRTQRSKLLALGILVEELINRESLQRHLKVLIDGEAILYFSQVKQEDPEEWIIIIRTYRQYDGPPIPELELDWEKASSPPAKATRAPSLSKAARRKRSRARRRAKKQKLYDRPGGSPPPGNIVYFTPEATLPHKAMFLFGERWFFCQIDSFDGDNFHATIEDPDFYQPERIGEELVLPVDKFRTIPPSLYKFIPNPFGAINPFS